MAAAAHMVGLVFVNASGAGQWMAPWGGREARLSTNPLAFACPTGTGTPVSLDVSEAHRRADGLFVEDETWDRVLAFARDLGVTLAAA